MTLISAAGLSGAYFDLCFLAGLRADWLDDITVVTPDFLIIHLQATLIPASHMDVGVLIFTDVLEVHDFIPEVKQADAGF